MSNTRSDWLAGLLFAESAFKNNGIEWLKYAIDMVCLYKRKSPDFIAGALAYERELNSTRSRS